MQPPQEATYESDVRDNWSYRKASPISPHDQLSNSSISCSASSHNRLMFLLFLPEKMVQPSKSNKKRLNAGQPNLSSLVFLLLCVRLKQLIRPIQELLVAPLQYTKIDMSSTLSSHLLSGSLRCKK